MAFEKDLCVIRNARPDEVERIGVIERDAGAIFAETEFGGLLNGETIPADELSEFIDGGSVWVAATLDGDIAVGFVVLTTLGENAHVEELDVLPEFGRLGLGSALLEYACSRSAERNFPAVTLSTFRDIPWNAPFYQKHGFEIVDDDALTEKMIRLREIESAKGLPVDRRVVMVRQLIRN